jgi:hypothetical protein
MDAVLVSNPLKRVVFTEGVGQYCKMYRKTALLWDYRSKAVLILKKEARTFGELSQQTYLTSRNSKIFILFKIKL